ARNTRLLGPEKFTGAAQFEIEFRDLETVVRAHHGVKTALAFFGNLATAHQHTIRFRRAAPDASAQLVELRQTKAVGVLDHHHSRVGHVDADFDHRGRDQNLDLALLKFAHYTLFFVGIKTAMQQTDMKVGENLLAQLAVHLLGGLHFALFCFRWVLFDHRINDVGLMSGGDLLADEVPDFGRALVLHAARNPRRASRRKFVEHRDVKVTVESERE